MNSVISTLLTMHGPAVYAVITVLVFLEAAAFVGLVMPSETAVVVGGVLASRGNLSLPLLAGLVTIAAVVGDSLGYLVGRRFGPAIRLSRAGRWIGTPRWDRAHAYVQSHGAWAVVLGRWVGMMRAMVPATAGMVGLSYRRFLAANLVGVLAWVAGVLAMGYLAAGSITSVQGSLGLISTIGAVALVAVIIAAILRRSRRGRLQLGGAEPGSAGPPVASP
ncbi:MAG: DedA family protein [Propionibacteriaceae bacterium]